MFLTSMVEVCPMEHLREVKNFPLDSSFLLCLLSATKWLTPFPAPHVTV